MPIVNLSNRTIKALSNRRFSFSPSGITMVITRQSMRKQKLIMASTPARKQRQIYQLFKVIRYYMTKLDAINFQIDLINKRALSKLSEIHDKLGYASDLYLEGLWFPPKALETEDLKSLKSLFNEVRQNIGWHLPPFFRIIQLMRDDMFELEKTIEHIGQPTFHVIEPRNI